MGIHALLPFVDATAGSDVHLSDFAGQTAAIDGYYWLHKGAKKCAMEMVRGTYATGFVDYCLQQVDRLASHGVEALVVLDGAPLPAKRGTEDKRRGRREKAAAEANELLRSGPYNQAQSAYLKAVNITPEHAFQLIEALRRKGVRYVVAPYEADAQIARLARSGAVQARAPPSHSPPHARHRLPCLSPPARVRLAARAGRGLGHACFRLPAGPHQARQQWLW